MSALCEAGVCWLGKVGMCEGVLEWVACPRLRVLGCGCGVWLKLAWGELEK